MEVPGGTAVMSEWAWWDPEADPGGEMATIESQGVIQVDDRVELLVMSTQGMDSNWALSPDDGTGLPVHPMVDSMPKAAERLVG